MTRSFTPNVILTKSSDAIDELFFASNTFRNTFSESIKRLDGELIKSFIVSPLENNSFLSMEYNFPRSEGEEVHPTVTMTFVESSEIIEYFALNQGPLSDVIRSRLQGTTQDKKIIQQGFNVSLQSLNESFNQYFLSFGVGDNLNEWAGPFRLTLQDADIVLNSDGVRQLELFFVPDTKGLTQVTSRIASVRDYRLFKNKLKAADSKKSSIINQSETLVIPLKELKDDPNDYLRCLLHTYIQNLTTDGGASPNVLTCIPQDLNKVGYKYSTTVRDTRIGTGKVSDAKVDFNEFYSFDKIGAPTEFTKPQDFYTGRSQSKGQIAALFNKFGIQIEYVVPNDPVLGMVDPFGAEVEISIDGVAQEPELTEQGRIVKAMKDSQEIAAKEGNSLDNELVAGYKKEFEEGIRLLAVSNGKGSSVESILAGITYPISVGPQTGLPQAGATTASVGQQAGATARYLGTQIYGNSNVNQLGQLEIACFSAKQKIDKAKEPITREVQKRVNKLDKDKEKDAEGFSRGEGFNIRYDGGFGEKGSGPYAESQERRAQRKYRTFATIQDPDYERKYGSREEYDQFNSLGYLYGVDPKTGSPVQRIYRADTVIEQRVNRIKAKQKLQKDLSRSIKNVPEFVLVRMKGVSNFDKDDTETLLDPVFKFYEALKVGSGGQPVDDFRLVYESDQRVLRVMKKYGIISDINQPLVMYGDARAILYFLYGHDSEGVFNPELMFDYFSNNVIDWESYRKDIRDLQMKKGRTSSLNEQINHSLIRKVNKSNLGVTTDTDNNAIFFQYNMANANVRDVGYSFKGYVADMYSLPMENQIQTSALQAQVDLIAKDDDAQINVISRVIESLPGFKAAKSLDAVTNLIVGRLLSNDKKKVRSFVGELSKVPGFTTDSTKDFVSFIEAVSYLAFVRGGGKPSFMSISNDDSLAEKYTHVLKRLYQRVVSLDIKTSPFFNQVIYIDKPCEFFGIQNSVKGGALDGVLIPSYLNGEYKIVGAKHVITNNADAYSEFTLVKRGFLGGSTTVALGDALKALIAD